MSTKGYVKTILNNCKKNWDTKFEEHETEKSHFRCILVIDYNLKYVGPYSLGKKHAEELAFDQIKDEDIEKVIGMTIKEYSSIRKQESYDSNIKREVKLSKEKMEDKEYRKEVEMNKAWKPAYSKKEMEKINKINEEKERKSRILEYKNHNYSIMDKIVYYKSVILKYLDILERVIIDHGSGNIVDKESGNLRTYLKLFNTIINSENDNGFDYRLGRMDCPNYAYKCGFDIIFSNIKLVILLLSKEFITNKKYKDIIYYDLEKVKGEDSISITDMKYRELNKGDVHQYTTSKDNFDNIRFKMMGKDEAESNEDIDEDHYEVKPIKPRYIDIPKDLINSIDIEDEIFDNEIFKDTKNIFMIRTLSGIWDYQYYFPKRIICGLIKNISKYMVKDFSKSIFKSLCSGDNSVSRSCFYCKDENEYLIFNIIITPMINGIRKQYKSYGICTKCKNNILATTVDSDLVCGFNGEDYSFLDNGYMLLDKDSKIVSDDDRYHLSVQGKTVESIFGILLKLREWCR